MHPEGGACGPTVTVVDAGGEVPYALLAVTENVDVDVMLAWTVGVVCPLTPGPLHRYEVAGLPPEHAAVSVTGPPPGGSVGGLGVIEQFEGAVCGPTFTVTVTVGAAPDALLAVIVYVDVEVIGVTTTGDVMPVAPGPVHA